MKNPDSFKYKVSMIVPVYNVEKYVAKCLDSLINQTINKDEMEILCINDGSTDESLEICKTYAKIYPNIKLFSKDNEGLSATRNFGILRAAGKYIMYIDSDDMITPETVKAVTDFFDTVYDEVDEVAYLDQGYKNGKKMPLHYRYNYLKKSGVYDLDKYPFLTQTRINVCVKNKKNNNILFNTTPGFRQEDQEYNCRVLQEKMKLGYCDKGEYQYNRSNETSIMATSYNAIAMFETCMKYFEDMFGSFGDTVPQYYQAMYIHDLQWKIRANILLPYHYNDKDFKIAVQRITSLLNRVDIDVIMNHPDMDNFHRYFWISLKPNSNAMFLGNSKQVAIVANGKYLYTRPKIELILYRIRIFNGKVKVLLCAKSPVFTFTDKPKVIAIITSEEGQYELDMDVMPSSFNYYRSKTETNRFWFFYFEHEVDKMSEFKFQVEIDGIKFETNYYFMKSSPYDLNLSMLRYIQDNVMISFNNNIFYIKVLSDIEKENIWHKQTELLKTKHPEEYLFRKKLLSYKKEKPIWLYYDCKGVEYDNAYLQFIHDFEKADGIDRYYISANSYEQRKTFFNDAQKENVITFGGELHKILYTHADKILTAYIEDVNVSPFLPEEAIYYKDLFHFEIIYLQHGILHATLPWKYTPERINVDKVVISSHFERENFVHNYNFREKDLIPTGMPRYELMDQESTPKNRILFAPTWRNYLIIRGNNGEWIPDVHKFTSSEYFLEIQEFLNNKELNQMLEKNNLYLDFKIHPIFRCYLDCFSITGKRVAFADDIVDDNQYAVFITDFSSFVFDFAYLKRPIIYFVPDMLQFRGGLNQYRKLDLPFEKAFGELVLTGDDAVTSIKKIIKDGMMPEKIYQNRMDSFYLDLSDCREKLYQNL